MKIYNRISFILVNVILILFLLSNSVHAIAQFSFDAVNWFDKQIDVGELNDLKARGGKIVGIIQVIGTIVSVGMLMVLGIKYVMGSVEQKAEYKKSMLPYLIGAILIFGVSNITQIIYKFAINI